MIPFDFWGWLLWNVERQFASRHSEGLPSPSAMPVEFSEAARSRHVAWYGISGTGKSMGLLSVALQEIMRRLRGESERGIVVFDVHGEFFELLKSHLAQLAKTFPLVYELFVPIDPINPRWSVRFNPLIPVGDQLFEDRSNILSDTINTLFADDPMIVVRMRAVMYHAFLTLQLAGMTLLDISTLLNNKNYREGLVFELNNPILTDYWMYRFPEQGNDLRTYIESTFNRLEPLLHNPRLRVLFTPPATIDFRELIDRGCIIVVNAPEGTLSPTGSYLLCGLVLSEITQALLSRSDLFGEE